MNISPPPRTEGTVHASASSEKAGLQAAGEPYAELREVLQGDSHLPLYRRLADQLTEWIETGRLRPGAQLLAERSMSEALGVSRRTVRAALGDLIDRRYVSATHGCGNFVLQPPRLRKTRILALEKFRKEPVFPHLRHHDLIHEAETRCRVEVHYKYVPTAASLRSTLESPPSGYDGILLYRPSQDWLELLAKEENTLYPKIPVPLLVAGRSLPGSKYHFVSPDHAGQTREAAKRLIAKGHKRIGYFSGMISQDYMRLANQGFEQALKNSGHPLFQEDVLTIESLGGSDTEMAIRKFLARRKFTALVVAGSALSASFENAVQRAAVHIPAELSVVLVTEKEALDHLALRWSAVLYPDELIPRSLEILSDLAADPDTGPIQELLAFGEVAGATCQAAPIHTAEPAA